MKKLLTILFLSLSLGMLAQTIPPFKDSRSADMVYRIIQNTKGTGVSAYALVTGTDTAWLVWDGDDLNIVATQLLYNGAPIEGGGSADLGNYSFLGDYLKHLTVNVLYAHDTYLDIPLETTFGSKVKVTTLDNSLTLGDNLVGWNATDKYLKGITMNPRIKLENNVLDADYLTAIWNADKLQDVPLPASYSDGDILVYRTSSGEFEAEAKPTGGGFTTDPILRIPVVGEVFNGYYFAPPTISISLSPSTTVYEVGTSNSITISGTVSNPGSATLSNGELVELNAPTTVTTFADNTTYSSPILFEPQQGGSANYEAYTYRFQANQDWVSGSESGNVTSSTKTIYGVFPVFYFTSDQDYTSGNVNIQTLEGAGETIYSLIEREGDKSVAFSSVADSYAYFLFPQTWVDETFSSIKDPSGYETKNGWSYTTITVTNSTKYTAESYKCVRTNLLSTYTGSPVYTFKQ